MEANPQKRMLKFRRKMEEGVKEQKNSCTESNLLADTSKNVGTQSHAKLVGVAIKKVHQSVPYDASNVVELNAYEIAKIRELIEFYNQAGIQDMIKLVQQHEKFAPIMQPNSVSFLQHFNNLEAKTQVAIVAYIAKTPRKLKRQHWASASSIDDVAKKLIEPILRQNTQKTESNKHNTPVKIKGVNSPLKKTTMTKVASVSHSACKSVDVIKAQPVDLSPVCTVNNPLVTPEVENGFQFTPSATKNKSGSSDSSSNNDSSSSSDGSSSSSDGSSSNSDDSSSSSDGSSSCSDDDDTNVAKSAKPNVVHSNKPFMPTSVEEPQLSRHNWETYFEEDL